MNSFIHLAQQLGLIERSYYNNLPNATICKTINDVYESYMQKRGTVIVELENIYGMLALFGIGVGVALITIIAEKTILVRKLKRNSQKYKVACKVVLYYLDNQAGNGQKQNYEKRRKISRVTELIVNVSFA